MHRDLRKRPGSQLGRGHVATGELRFRHSPWKNLSSPRAFQIRGYMGKQIYEEIYGFRALGFKASGRTCNQAPSTSTAALDASQRPSKTIFNPIEHMLTS